MPFDPRESRWAEEQARIEEFHAWVEHYVRQEVERELEARIEARHVMETEALREHWLNDTDADGFTAEDREFLRQLHIGVR